MSVGTGGINRAARAGKKVADTALEKPVQVSEENDKVKTAAKKAPAKKSTVKKSPRPMNECCQLTQELPIHLL